MTTFQGSRLHQPQGAVLGSLSQTLAWLLPPEGPKKHHVLLTSSLITVCTCHMEPFGKSASLACAHCSFLLKTQQIVQIIITVGGASGAYCLGLHPGHDTWGCGIDHVMPPVPGSSAPNSPMAMLTLNSNCEKEVIHVSSPLLFAYTK